MPMPKSVTRQCGASGIKIVDSVDKCQYTINELCRAALRDVGKYVVITTNKKAQKLPGMAKSKRVKGTRHAFQYWVRKNKGLSDWPDCQIGIRHDTWYGVNQEFGTKKMKKKGFLMESVSENIPNIVKIESQYLSAMESEARALSLINEGEYKGEEDNDALP